jgi:membrane-bound ClpP family serine protease
MNIYHRSPTRNRFEGVTTRNWIVVDYILTDEGILRIGLAGTWLFILVWAAPLIVLSIVLEQFPGVIIAGIFGVIAVMISFLFAKLRRMRIASLSPAQLKSISFVKLVHWTDVTATKFEGKQFRRMCFYTKFEQTRLRNWSFRREKVKYSFQIKKEEEKNLNAWVSCFTKGSEDRSS